MPNTIEHTAARDLADRIENGSVAEKSRIYRKRSKHLGVSKPSRFPGSRDSIWKKKMDGSVVRR